MLLLLVCWCLLPAPSWSWCRLLDEAADIETVCVATDERLHNVLLRLERNDDESLKDEYDVVFMVLVAP